MSDAEIATLKERVASLTIVLTDSYNRLRLPALKDEECSTGNTIDELDNSLVDLLRLAKAIWILSGRHKTGQSSGFLS